MKKKLLAVLLVMVMVVPMVLASVYANNYPVPNLDPSLWETDRHRGISQVAVVAHNGQNLAALTTTLWEGGSTYLPVREVAEGLGLHIHYVADTRSIYIVDSENATHVPAAAAAEVGSFNLFRNDTQFDVAFKIVEDKSYVSAAALAEVLGFTYYEDIRTNTVYYFDATAALKDGEYTAVGTESRGWVPQIDVTVSGGKITEVTFNDYNVEDGRGKKFDEAYNTNWKSRYPEADLATAIDALEAQLLAVQEPAKVDVVSGATSASDNFKELAAKAVGKAQTAQADEAKIVSLGGEVVDGYKDGEYVVVGLADSRGWASQVNFVVEGGKITEATYNSFNADGEGKREDGAGYLTNWTSRYPDVDPVAIVAAAEAQLVKTQDPNLVDATTGATSWGNDLKRFVAGALYHAARVDFEIGAEDTIYVFIGDSTAHSAYWVELLAVAEGNEVKAIDYIEFQRGTPLAKPHNPGYVGTDANWWKNYNENPEYLNGRTPLEVREEMTAYAMEHKTYEVDAISGATNWGYGYEQLVPRAFQIIESK